MNERLKIMGKKMMVELYKKAKPSANWDDIVTKYKGTKETFHDKHFLSQKDAEKILDKYKAKCRNKSEKDSLAFLWLGYSPTSKCPACYGHGLWAVGDPSPVGPMDASDGVPTKRCPVCGAGGKNEKRTRK